MDRVDRVGDEVAEGQIAGGKVVEDEVAEGEG